MQGVKHDTGKPDLSMITRELVEEVARVRMFGAAKYARDNWKLGMSYNRQIAAALRHIHAFNSGENQDPESGLSHLAHAVCCLEHLIYYQADPEQYAVHDDRYKNPQQADS